MEYKRKINSEIKNNYKFNIQKNENSHKQNIIWNKKNSNLKSNLFKMTWSNSKSLNKINERLNVQNNKKYNTNINKLKKSNSINNINEENKKIDKIFVNTLKNREKTINYDNINNSNILNKIKLKKKKINIRPNDNNKGKEQSLNILDRISSKYILKGIFYYIHDKFFKLKLIKHSNLFKKKLDINIFDYQEEYLYKNRFDIIKYFSFLYRSSENISKNFLNFSFFS